MSALLVHCTCPDAASAQRIARTLVEERLAACVQMVPAVQSVYRWQGQVQHDDEALLLIKTASVCWDALVARVTELHPYEVPELLAFNASSGSAPYLHWLDTQTGAP